MSRYNPADFPQTGHWQRTVALANLDFGACVTKSELRQDTTKIDDAMVVAIYDADEKCRAYLKAQTTPLADVKPRSDLGEGSPGGAWGEPATTIIASPDPAVEALATKIVEDVPMLCMERHYGPGPYSHSGCIMSPDWSVLRDRIAAALAARTPTRVERCPVCQVAPRGEEYHICETCHWEDDQYQLEHPDETVGANALSFNDARRAWLARTPTTSAQVCRRCGGTDMYAEVWTCRQCGPEP